MWIAYSRSSCVDAPFHHHGKFPSKKFKAMQDDFFRSSQSRRRGLIEVQTAKVKIERVAMVMISLQISTEN
jgi:hypothetical protein